MYNQSGEDGAISTVRAAADPSLTGKGFKYFGPWYKGPLVTHTGNESKPTHLVFLLTMHADTLTAFHCWFTHLNSAAIVTRLDLCMKLTAMDAAEVPSRHLRLF